MTTTDYPAARVALVLASRNRKKAREMAELLVPVPVELISVADFPNAPVVEETGTTFGENAALKARAVAQATGRWTLADDSGLAVDELHGAPGVYSARYAGPDAHDAQNNERLLAELRDVPDERRGAQFICCLAVADPAGTVRIQVSGRCRGRLLHAPRGENGFGYDPLFFVPEYWQTFAELSAIAKGALSHRARAFEHLRPRLAAVLREL